ncbi:MAG: GNAT family N-acetyltransferase [Planctomycetota bacterium]|nr:GNAT family N-acetyltransferase [Planctomycetota bacterium]
MSTQAEESAKPTVPTAIPRAGTRHSEEWWRRRGFRVRQYRPEDHEALRAIWKACDISLGETDTAEAIARNLRRRSNGFRIFVVETTGEAPAGVPRLVGGVVTTFDGHRAYVYHLAVHPQFRAGGLGRLLLETCEWQAQRWGARHLRLTSLTANMRTAARRMYAAAGWRPRKELWVYSKDL